MIHFYDFLMKRMRVRVEVTVRGRDDDDDDDDDDEDDDDDDDDDEEEEEEEEEEDDEDLDENMPCQEWREALCRGRKTPNTGVVWDPSECWPLDGASS